MTISEPVEHLERAVSEPAAALPRRARRRAASFDDGLMGVALLAGPANVIMQLARPGVGYGVLESRVESGRVDRHPIKRARTTFTYLAVATKGCPEQKAAFRRAVNRAHAQVYSTDESPVEYHAFDRDLQLWVGACLGAGYAFGNVPVVKNNFSLVAIGIVAVSLIPMAVEWIRHRRKGASA